MHEHEWVAARETPSVGAVFGLVVVAVGALLAAGALVADAPQPLPFVAAGAVLATLGMLLAARGRRRSDRRRQVLAEGIEVEGRIAGLERTNTQVGSSAERRGYLYRHTITSDAQTFVVKAHRLGAEGSAVRLRYLPGHEDEALVVAVQRPAARSPSPEQRAAWAAAEARSGGRLTITSRTDED